MESADWLRMPSDDISIYYDNEAVASHPLKVRLLSVCLRLGECEVVRREWVINSGVAPFYETRLLYWRL